MRNLYWGIILVGLGILLLLDNLEIADFHEVLKTYWPLLIIVWGASILMRKRTNVTETQTVSSTATSTQTSASALEQDLLHQSNVFGDLSVTIVSQNFKGGSLSTVFGDCFLDLTKAQIAEGEHALHVHSVFGSSMILLPKDAAVSVTGSSVFGTLTILEQRRGGFAPDIKTSSPDFSSAIRKMNISLSQIFGDGKVQ
jgi:predicted membrane protein